MSGVLRQSSDTVPQDGLPPGQRGWAVATIVLAVGMASLDTSIANTALPTIATDLLASPASSVWIVNAYQLAIVVSLLPFASLGEIYGYRRVYLIGLAVFTLASVVCAFSWSLPSLTAARVLQGLGASGIMSVNTALVRFIYPARALGRGVGFNALVVGVSTALGPTVAAGVLSVASWQWLFAINGPVGIVALALAVRTLPTTPLARHRFDARSALLNALTFGLLIFGIGEAAHSAPGPVIAAVLAGAVGAGVLLVRRQLSLAAPLLPVDLYRRPMFALSSLTSVCSFAESSTTSTSVSLPMTTSSPASIVVDSSQVLSTAASPPAATASSPEATFASLSNVWVTSPSAQMFWLTDWSMIVSRSSIDVNWLVMFLISRTTGLAGVWCSGVGAGVGFGEGMTS